MIFLYLFFLFYVIDGQLFIAHVNNDVLGSYAIKKRFSFELNGFILSNNSNGNDFLLSLVWTRQGTVR